MPDVDLLTRQVADLLRSVGQTELLPRLEGAHRTAEFKSPGEVVTAADGAAEGAIARGLTTFIEDAVIIGEEAAHADPTLLEGLERHPWAWILDPLDGTREFAQGRGPFGSMVALLRRGRTEAAWIHLPLLDRTATAWRGRGARMDGAPLRIPAVDPNGGLRGGLMTRFFPQVLRKRAESQELADALREVAGGFERTDGAHHCAAQRYVDLLDGGEHFAAYWRTLPWDHLPGALLVQEAGGVVRRLDGSEYRAAVREGEGLLVAADEPTWERMARAVLG